MPVNYCFCRENSHMYKSYSGFNLDFDIVGQMYVAVKGCFWFYLFIDFAFCGFLFKEMWNCKGFF